MATKQQKYDKVTPSAAATKKGRRTNAEKTAVATFLKKQLDWLELSCLRFSAAAATGDCWAKGQLERFHSYKGNVKHLLYLNGTPSGDIAKAEINAKPV